MRVLKSITLSFAIKFLMLFLGFVLGVVFFELSGKTVWVSNTLALSTLFLLFLSIIFNPVFLAYHLNDKLAETNIRAALAQSKKVLFVLFLIDVIGFFLFFKSGVYIA